MRTRTVGYQEIIARIVKTGTEAALVTRIIKAYMAIIADHLTQGLTYDVPKFGKFHVVAEPRTSFNIMGNVKHKTGQTILTPSDAMSNQYQYLPAVEFHRDNKTHNTNFYLNLVPKLWQPILSLIRENKLHPKEHGYSQESIV